MKVTAHAIVRVTVEVPVGSWGQEATFQEIQRNGKREAIQKLEHAGNKAKLGIRVLEGTTQVTAVVVEDDPNPKRFQGSLELPDVVVTIGTLDRVISELLLLAGNQGISDADRKTLLHHADDMKGAAEKVQQLLFVRIDG